ncbi:MAG: pilus assembly protein, partial [Caldimicrobium sp.]
TYKKRTIYLITGANDGMLHAFRVGYFNETGDPNKPLRLIDAFSTTSISNIGKEEWAFIPRNAIPYLIWYGHSGYCRVPIIDYRTFVVDASIGGEANVEKTAGSWRTLLIGVMGFGGKQLASYSSSIFVLDLTDWLNGNTDKPTLLWEKTLPDNTLTLSFPVVVRRGEPAKNGDWYVVIGSGPKDPKGETFVTNPKIYVFNLRDGSLVQGMSIPDAQNMAVGDLYAADVDNDYQDDVIYFGTYSTSTGNLYRMKLSDFSISKAFTVNAPIFAAPNITKGERDTFWVYFATGRFLRTEDKDFNYTNYLVGFKDECIKGACTTTYTLNDLLDRTNFDYSNRIIARTEFTCMCSWDGCRQEEVVVDSYYNGTSPSEPPRGWYHRLTNNATHKEMIYSQPFVFGRNLDALIFRTSEDICKIGGETYFMALCYNTGALCPKPSVITTVDKFNQVKIFLAQGAPPFGQPFVITLVGKDTYTVITSIGGTLTSLGRGLSETSRFILWIEK